ncbi:MAG: CaiB/BaiF CoA transferase family protein [Burkholderiaceae bacterium]
MSSATPDIAAAPGAGRGPLHGLRVIDMTAVISGPFATQTLGELGADVIKVEPPEGDGQRRIGPARAPEMGPIYINSNRAKRSVALNLKAPEGRDILLRLAATADVLLFNIRPSAMQRLGLSYETLNAVNPRLIYVGISGFADGGPYTGRPAYDDLIQSGSTLAHMVAMKSGGAPQYVPVAIADRVTGLTAAMAVLAAVIERQSSGRGQQVDVPMYETLLNFVLADHLGGLSFDPPLDAGGYPRLLAPGRKPYATQDGYVAAMMFTDRQWRSFYALLGREAEFDADPRMRDLGTRNQHIDALYAEVEAVFAGRTTAFWLEALERADIPVMQVHDLRSVFDDPHLRATGFFETEHHPSQGTLRRMRHPLRWSRSQPPARRHAPLPGEHSMEVLREAGLTPEELAGLTASGVVAVPNPEPIR